VLHGGAEGFRGEQTYVDLHAVAQVEADLVVAASDYVHQRWVLCHVGDGFLAPFFSGAGFSGDQDIKVADSFTAAAQRSGGRDLLNPGKLLDIGGDLFALDLGRVDQEASADAAIIFDGL